MIAHLWKFIYYTIMFWALKDFFCSNISSLYIAKQVPRYVQAVKAKDAIHGIVCIPMAIKITRI